MSRYSPSGIQWGRQYERGFDRSFDRGMRIGENIGDAAVRGFEQSEQRARRAWEDELEGRRYREAQDRQARRDASVDAQARAAAMRQGAVDAAAGMYVMEGEDPRLAQTIADPLTGEQRPAYENLNGNYYRDVKRSPGYTDATRQANLRTAAKVGGIDPQMADALGEDFVQETIDREDQQKHALELANAQSRNRQTEIGMRGTGTVGGRPAPSRVAPMGVMQDVGNNDTIHSLTQQALGYLQQVPEAVGAGGYLPETLRSLGTGEGNRPNAFGRMMTAIPGVKPGAFTQEATLLWSTISDLLSRQLLQRSGAAVTVSEFARIKPYVPSRKDPPATLRYKLDNIARIVQEETEFLRSNYGPDQGYYPMETRSIPNSGPQQDAGTTGGAPDPTGGFLNRFTVRRP